MRRKSSCPYTLLYMHSLYLTILLLLEQESCQTVNVSSEAWLICQDAVEPTEMLANLLHYHARIHHGKQGTDAHDVPLPSTKEDEREDDCQDNQ